MTTKELTNQNHEELINTNRRLLVELQAMSSRISAVYEIASAINQKLDIDEIFSTMGRQAKWLFDFDHFSICYQSEETTYELTTLFGQPPAADYLNTDEAAPLWQAIQTNQAQLIRPVQLTGVPHSKMIIPLSSEKVTLGAMYFVSYTATYTQDDLRIGYMLGIQLATAIRNAIRFNEINCLYGELEKTYYNLKQAEQARDDLTNMIIHDLRTPLTSILFGLEIFQMANEDKFSRLQKSHLIKKSQESAKMLSGMIDDMLDLGKFEEGRLQPNLASVNVKTFFADMRPMFTTIINNYGIRLDLFIEPDLPSMWFDKELVCRVITNLLTNAGKYGRDGSKVSLIVKQRANHLIVAVRDYGVGISEVHQKKIFDKFVQVSDENGQSVRRGVGLGLAFCKLAIEAHNGCIGVKSQEGKGSTFYFALPITSICANR